MVSLSLLHCFMQDPEFFEFLKEHDKELLQFNDEDVDVSMQSKCFYCTQLVDSSNGYS